MSRRFWAPVALALALIACSGSTSETTATVAGPAEPVETTTTLESPLRTTTTASTSTTQPDLSSLEGLSDEVKDQLAELIVVTQRIRELPFLSPPLITVVTPDELARRVMESIEEESEDFPADDALYTLLGLLDPDVDLGELLIALYGEQAAGFYDSTAGEIVVRANDDGFTPLQQATLVHELVHALADQHHAYHVPLQEMSEGDRFDEASAYLALVEGDAQLAELLWIETLSQSELGQLAVELFQLDRSVFESAPLFIQDALIFPYDSGLNFVQSLYEGGGWASVDAAYATFPTLPPSTEQVITPADLGRDLPLVVEIPDIEIPGYQLVVASSWGEFGFRIMLDQVVGAVDAARAADGWGGDTYYQWFDGENAAIVIGIKTDSARDLVELEDALVAFAFESVPDEDFVWVETVGDILYFIAADEGQVGFDIRAAVGAG